MWDPYAASGLQLRHEIPLYLSHFSIAVKKPAMAKAKYRRKHLIGFGAFQGHDGRARAAEELHSDLRLGAERAH